MDFYTSMSSFLKIKATNFGTTSRQQLLFNVSRGGAKTFACTLRFCFHIFHNHPGVNYLEYAIF